MPLYCCILSSVIYRGYRLSICPSFLRFRFFISLCIFWSVKREFVAKEAGVLFDCTFLPVILIIGALWRRGRSMAGAFLYIYDFKCFETSSAYA